MAKSLRRKLREIHLEGAYSAEENARLILEERTRMLAARQPAEVEPAIAAAPVLVCQAGGERYGIALTDVAGILPAQPCVPIPGGPPALVGILGRRGYPVSVIDLGAALNLPSPPDGIFHHFVLLRREHPRVALRVERAESVVAARPLASEEGHAFRSEAVIGYADMQSSPSDENHVLSMLDVERLLRPLLPSSSNNSGV